MKPDALWTNLSVREITDRMAELGTLVDRSIVEQLLDQAQLGRRQAAKTTTMAASRDRNQQFETIAFYKKLYVDSLNPILCVDTKKRERLGPFYRDGHTFTTQTIGVFDHDYPSFADGQVIPHGLYDLKRNRGYLNLGGSYDTSEFACDSIYQWWTAEGHLAWSGATHVPRACQGVIFPTVEQVRHDMAKTKTRTGLSVVVNIVDKVYEKGRQVAEGFQKTRRIVFDNILPRFNYRALPLVQ